MSEMFAILVLAIIPIITKQSIAERMLYEKEKRQESQTISSYNCDERSYFNKISRIVSDNFVIECNAVYQGRTNFTALATLQNGDNIPLRISHSCFILRDINGAELYSNLGIVMDGQCVGAIVYIYGLSKVSIGSCDSPSGVTNVEVPKGYALFSLRGTCDSTCWGTVTTSYNPGKTNSFENDQDSGFDDENEEFLNKLPRGMTLKIKN